MSDQFEVLIPLEAMSNQELRAIRITRRLHCGAVRNGEVDYVYRKHLPFTDGRTFQCFFNFLGWHHWSLGLHFDPTGPNAQVHVPFGYAGIGWRLNRVDHMPRSFGWY